jgi:Icc-related predicted phosphoesterase
MKLWVLSDLHLEFEPQGLALPAPEADVCIVAGDVYTRGPARSIAMLAALIPDMRTVFVAGNHEFHGSFVLDGLKEARREAARHPNIHFLEDESVELDGVLFAGATLWTDFELFGAPQLAMGYCKEEMNDYRRAGWSKKPYAKLHPAHTARKHHRSREFLDRFLAEQNGRKSVVVTHTAPSLRSIAPRHRNDIASAAYASPLDDLIQARGPNLWVHGHVHHALDYTIGRTRIVCNPRGYSTDTELEQFDPRLAIEF